MKITTAASHWQLHRSFLQGLKNIALKYHHFRRYVKDKTIEIFPINTTEQIADIFTKPLDEAAYIYLRKELNGG